MRPNGVADAQTVEIPSPPKRVKHRDTYEVSEPGVGSGSDRGKLVPKSEMEDGEKSCVYFCGARTANRHR